MGGYGYHVQRSELDFLLPLGDCKRSIDILSYVRGDNVVELLH